MRAKYRSIFDEAQRAARTALRGCERSDVYVDRRLLSHELLFGGGSFVDPLDRKSVRHVLSIFAADADEVALIGTPFLPHGVSFDPRNASRAIVFEKIGPGCAVFDLQRGRAVDVVIPLEGRWFYGHGAFSPDGEWLYSTETIRATGAGMVGVRRADSLAYEGEFPTYGDSPHDCHLIEDGKKLVVTNGGSTYGSGKLGSVCIIDVASRKLVEKFDISDARFNAGHVDMHGDLMAVVSAPQHGMGTQAPGAVSLKSDAEPRRLETLYEPVLTTSKMRGETLSVAIHGPSRQALVTNPLGGFCSLWRFGEANNASAFVAEIALPRPRGVTLNAAGDRFIVSFGETGQIGQFKINANSLESDDDLVHNFTFTTGSHLFHYGRLTSATKLGA